MTVSHRCYCVVYSCSDASIAAWNFDYPVGKKDGYFVLSWFVTFLFAVLVY